MRSDEFQIYLIARDYNISLVKKQFHSVRSISRSKARQVKQKVTKESFNLVTVYNPLLNNLQKVIKNNLPLLCNDPVRAGFPEGSINVTYRRGKNLKELISPSLFPQPQLATKLQFMVSECGKNCDIFYNFLVCRKEFISKVTGKTFKVRGNLSCNSANVAYEKIVSITFLLACFLSLNESSSQTRKTTFYFTSKALFVLEKIKF